MHFVTRGKPSDSGKQTYHGRDHSIDIKIEVIAADRRTKITRSLPRIRTRILFHAHEGRMKYTASDFLGTGWDPSAAVFFSGNAAQICDDKRVFTSLNRLVHQATHRVNYDRGRAAVDATRERDKVTCLSC